MATEQDSQIALLESYVLAANKDAFIKTLVPNSDNHKLVLTMHELNTRGLDLTADVADNVRKWKTGVQSMNDQQKRLVLRQLLQSIDGQTDKANIKTEIQNVDRLTTSKLNELKNYSKPVIFAAGDEFKEDSESKLSSVLSDSVCPDIYIKNLVQKVTDRPDLLNTLANESVLYYLDMEKLAKKDPDAVEKLLNSRTDFVNLKVRFGHQNIEASINAIFKHRKKTSVYYSVPNDWFNKMTLSQLTAIGKEISSCKSTVDFNRQLYEKTFDVNYC